MLALGNVIAPCKPLLECALLPAFGGKLRLYSIHVLGGLLHMGGLVVVALVEAFAIATKFCIDVFPGVTMPYCFTRSVVLLGCGTSAVG